MATSFPGAIDNLANPTATDFLDLVDHAGQHGNANDAIEAIETKLGTGSSTASSGTVLRGTGAGTTAFGQVASADIATNAVTTIKITDSNVTTAKIADSNVTTAKIADASVTAAKIAAEAYTTYTPTASGGISVLGNAVLFGSYLKCGKNVKGKISFRAGTTTTFDTPSIAFLLPFNHVTVSPTTREAHVGSAWLYDDSSTVTNTASVIVLSTDATKFLLRPNAATSAATGLVPWTWANLDRIELSFDYESV